MNWLKIQTSLFSCQASNTGILRTFEQILLTDFAVPHVCTYQNEQQEWVNETTNDMNTICQLRQCDSPQTKRKMKSTLQAYTPAAAFQSKRKGESIILHRTGVMQFDFDHAALEGYEIRDLKRAVFALPFVGFCGLSCSGTGFYALALIAEPEKLGDYAEHCFAVFRSYGLYPDESKGRKPENLRYVSYDANMLIRDYPTPLLIKKFYTQSAPKNITRLNRSAYNNDQGLIGAALAKIQQVRTGSRWQTVQQVAYTLGGLGRLELLTQIKSAIEANPEFAGEKNKYLKCAEDCFADGMTKPINNKYKYAY